MKYCFNGVEPGKSRAADGSSSRQVVEFHMLHAVPPQAAPDFVKDSPLVDTAGWLSVDQQTMRHPIFENVFSLGDIYFAPNAKTVAAVRQRRRYWRRTFWPLMHHRKRHPVYDGYGACPLTVERGWAVHVEFGCGGKRLPSFSIDPTKPSRLARLLKPQVLPPIYFHMLLRGRGWLAKPTMVDGALQRNWLFNGLSSEPII